MLTSLDPPWILETNFILKALRCEKAGASCCGELELGLGPPYCRTHGPIRMQHSLWQYGVKLASWDNKMGMPGEEEEG